VTLDALLARRATRAPSVELLERTRVTGLLWEDGRVAGARLSGPEGERTVRARVVIGADGRHSSIARQVGAQDELHDEPIRACYYCYVRGFAPREGDVADGPEFSLLENELAYVFPSDCGYTCLALSFGLDVFASLGPTRESRAACFARLLERHHGLAPRWQAATMEGGWLGVGPEPNYVRMPAGPGWALAGDASLHQDPWTGFGMDCAGVHGRALARSLIAWWRSEMSEDEAMGAYRQQRDEHGIARYRYTVDQGRDFRVRAAG
jgi:flavin-dependent dehydrogenase